MGNLFKKDNEAFVKALMPSANLQSEVLINLERVSSKHSTCMCCGVGNENNGLKLLNMGTTYQTTSIKLCPSCRHKLSYVLTHEDY